MPFDLASLEYAPFRRLKELATPYEFVKLKTLGLQHPLIEKLPAVITQNYHSISFYLEKIWLHSTKVSTKKQPCLVFRPSDDSCLKFSPNFEKIEPALTNELIMQPRYVKLSDFTFHKNSFIFFHPCRRFVTKLLLQIPSSYVFVGGEFDLIAAAFPVLEELIVYVDGHSQFDWIEYLNESSLKKSENLLVHFLNWKTPIIDCDRRKFFDLFDDANSGFKLLIELKRSDILMAIREFTRLGLCVNTRLRNSYDYSIEIYKDLRRPLVKISFEITMQLHDFNQLEFNDICLSGYFNYGSPDILFSGPIRLYSPSLQPQKIDLKFLNKKLRIESDTLCVENRALDNDVINFTKPFAHQVKNLEFNQITYTNSNYIVELFKLFPAVEKLTFSRLPRDGIELLLCNDLSNLKCITLEEKFISVLKFIRAKHAMMKELFKRAHSSFYLNITDTVFFSSYVKELENIRKLGFKITFLDQKGDWIKCHIRAGFQECISLKSATKKATIEVQPGRVAIRTPHETLFTAEYQKIQIIADQIVFKTAYKPHKAFPRLLDRFVIDPTVIHLTKCVDNSFFEYAERFSTSVKHVDLRDCRCKNRHPNWQMNRFRQTFPNLVKIWDHEFVE